MNTSLVSVVFGFTIFILITQVVECNDSRIMKHGRTITKKIGHYIKPLLAATEETATKVTRDVGVASKFTARNLINGMIQINQRLLAMLRYTKSKIGKKAGPAAAAPPAEVPAPAPE